MDRIQIDEEDNAMSERDHYEPGVPCWVDTLQPDPRAAVEFYSGVFGWEFVGPGPMPGGGEYFVARHEGRDVAGVGSLPSEGAPPGALWTTHVAVRSADDAAEKAKAAGGSVVAGPFDAEPAGRMVVLLDPSGAAISAWEPRERRGAQRVNEAGAWSMSILSTDDPDRAAEFYGAVFGWQKDVIEAGGSAFTLWRLPGYVGGEPQQPVPRDVVAAMMPAPGDTPPVWGVNFWVRSADDAAARAVELGGAVVVAPHETPGFRNAVLADPQGAVFSVTQVLALFPA
jgi:predicted enzyme related to lactoylglutathione lyase